MNEGVSVFLGSFVGGAVCSSIVPASQGEEFDPGFEGQAHC